MNKGTILIADDDAAIRMVLNQALSRARYQVYALSNTASLWQRVANGEGDLVITDVMMPDENAFDLLPRLKKARPEMPVIVMSAQNTFMTAIKAAQAGAYDYLPKPFDLGELIALVDRAMGELYNKAAPVEAEGGDGMLLVGRSDAMQDVYRIMARMMQTDLTVMITGESGTGKGLVARALHDYGQRCKGAFVTVNMAATPQDRIETELFGYEKGTFGGVPVRSGGRFEQAHGGTLFLDEIGDMPLAAQTQLLRLLQNGNDTIAGRMPVKADVRIIAATNKNLRQLIDQGRFREDLYYRLNIVPLRLPPLRERCEDIADLVRYFFRIICKDGQPLKHVTAEGLELLQRYPWPGNVRELENLMQRIAALYPHEEIDASVIEAELKSDMRDDTAQGADSPFLSGDITIAQAVELNMTRYFASFGEELPPRGLYHRILAEIEYPLVLACLTATQGNQIKAADVLGLNRNTLRKKIRDLGVNICRGA